MLKCAGRIDLLLKKKYKPVTKSLCFDILNCSSKTRKYIKMSKLTNKKEYLLAAASGYGTGKCFHSHLTKWLCLPMKFHLTLSSNLVTWVMTLFRAITIWPPSLSWIDFCRTLCYSLAQFTVILTMKLIMKLY